MDLCIKFLRRCDSKNKVLKPYHALFNLSRVHQKEQPYCLIYKALSYSLYRTQVFNLNNSKFYSLIYRKLLS